ncbi:MAG: helix-turn-helix transcriptional regulator [Clostridia bacterium]|nr:helix-turn-helix transcriptional regulator [Clostridia bacterium]
MKTLLELAIGKLGKDFDNLSFPFDNRNPESRDIATTAWLGEEDEDIMICVFKGKEINEPFHRQDFFFINYAYEKGYSALSAQFDNLIDVRQDECYIGQPYSGYAIRAKEDSEITIVGVLIRKETFYREYLSVLSREPDLFRFFIEPQKNNFSEEFIHLSFAKNHAVRSLLELMLIEYADKKLDTQILMKPFLSALLIEIARRYKVSYEKNEKLSLADEIVRYITSHSDTATLDGVAKQFCYHPNYISSLLHKQTGKTFTKILLDERMKKALLLLKNTTLSIEEIAAMLGYSDNSNFYKAFKDYYGSTPREYLLP